MRDIIRLICQISVMELFIANNSVYHQKSGFLSNIPPSVELWIAKVFEENILLPFIWQYLA
jgi:hypothetical protein